MQKKRGATYTCPACERPIAPGSNLLEHATEESRACGVVIGAVSGQDWRRESLETRTMCAGCGEEIRLTSYWAHVARNRDCGRAVGMYGGATRPRAAHAER